MPGEPAILVTSELLHALRRDLHAAPTWALADEVQVPTPCGSKLRFIDAVALQLTTPAAEMHGFELKVSRSDWLGELRKPQKSQAARDVVDKYWLVAGARDVYKTAEVPAEWGIIAPGKDGRLVVVRQAQRITPIIDPPAPWPRNMITAVLARALREDGPRPGFITKVERDAEARGYRKGLSAAKRQDTAAPARPTRMEKPVKMKYNPGRYNYDDGAPLDLP